MYAPIRPYRDAVRAAQKEYCSKSSNNAILIDTDGYPNDGLHILAAGQIQFGKDVYEALK